MPFLRQQRSTFARVATPKPDIDGEAESSGLSEISSDGSGSEFQPRPSNKPTREKPVTTKSNRISSRIEAQSMEGVESTVASAKSGLSAEEMGKVARWEGHELPLPWKGRLGYACLNTYLRTAHPPVFSSRTCRLSTLTKSPSTTTTTPATPPSKVPQKGKKKTNPERRPDPHPVLADLSHKNVADLLTILKFNQLYNIDFVRVSSDLFPFASHDKWGYDLEFAREGLREAGRFAALGGRRVILPTDSHSEKAKPKRRIGIRLTVHPGQYCQLGSPNPEVVRRSLLELDYHAQMMDFIGEGMKMAAGKSRWEESAVAKVGAANEDQNLGLPPWNQDWDALTMEECEQLDRDGIMILHLGGRYGNPAAARQRIVDVWNAYAQSGGEGHYERGGNGSPNKTPIVSDGVKRRLVLENDDVCWSVEETLSLCEELGIPMILDWHHHSVLPGPTLSPHPNALLPLLPRIASTWSSRNISQKMHYSEPKTWYPGRWPEGYKAKDEKERAVEGSGGSGDDDGELKEEVIVDRGQGKEEGEKTSRKRRKIEGSKPTMTAILPDKVDMTQNDTKTEEATLPPNLNSDSAANPSPSAHNDPYSNGSSIASALAHVSSPYNCDPSTILPQVQNSLAAPIACRGHSDRVYTLPPCDPWMDLMIEAKDKEQAVFEIRKVLGIDGDACGDGDEGLGEVSGEERRKDAVEKMKQLRKKLKPKTAVAKTGKGKSKGNSKGKGQKQDDEDNGQAHPRAEEAAPTRLPSPDLGGPERRVYWPEGREDKLKPPTRKRKGKKGAEAEDGEEGQNGDEKPNPEEIVPTKTSGKRLGYGKGRGVKSLERNKKPPLQKRKQKSKLLDEEEVPTSAGEDSRSPADPKRSTNLSRKRKRNTIKRGGDDDDD